jgi:regulator of replication initiation timing
VTTTQIIELVVAAVAGAGAAFVAIRRVGAQNDYDSARALKETHAAFIDSVKHLSDSTDEKVSLARDVGKLINENERLREDLKEACNQLDALKVTVVEMQSAVTERDDLVAKVKALETENAALRAEIEHLKKALEHEQSTRRKSDEAIVEGLHAEKVVTLPENGSEIRFDFPRNGELTE